MFGIAEMYGPCEQVNHLYFCGVQSDPVPVVIWWKKATFPLSVLAGKEWSLETWTMNTKSLPSGNPPLMPTEPIRLAFIVP